MKKSSFVLWSLVFLPFVLFSQQGAGIYTSVRGIIYDSVLKEPIANATVSLVTADNKEITASYTDNNGSFLIQVGDPGKYTLEISFTGFTTHALPVTVSSLSAAIDLDSIFLAPNNTYLKEVTVTTGKRLIESRPGMLIYHAENDLTNKGGSAADVLRKAPVLHVDARGNVTMRGSSQLKILVNGKYSGQMARSSADALNMMPADMIRAVEVITTPSARYDAEGAAGIINIITKKGQKNFNGTLEASTSNWEQMINPRLTFNNNKWSVIYNGHFHRLRSKSTTRLSRTTIKDGLAYQNLEQENISENAAPHGSGDLTVGYSADSSSELTFSVNTWFGKWPDNQQLHNLITTPDNNVVEEYEQTTFARDNYLGADFSAGYTKRLKKPGQELTMLAQFTPANSGSAYEIVQEDKTGTTVYLENNQGKTKNREWTIQVDYLHPLSASGKYLLESGLKMISRNVENDYTVKTSAPTDPEETIIRNDRSDLFKYRQDVLAGYSQVKANLSGNWYIEAGMRVEATFIEGSFRSSPSSFKSNFTNFVPTATLSKKIGSRQTVNISYTKRLTRPYIWDLNPNADASDPRNIRTGNPSLEAEIMHQAEITYGITGHSGFFLNPALFWKQTNNSMEDFTTADAAGISVTSKQNLASNKVMGLNLSSSFRFNNNWGINGNLNINHLDYKSTALQVLNKGWAAAFNLNSTYKLSRGYALQVFGEYDSRKISLQGYTTFRYYYSFAAKKQLTRNRMAVTLATTNLFTRFIGQTEVLNGRGFLSTLLTRDFNRSVKLTVNWEFGKMSQQRTKKKIINDDVNDKGKG